MLQFCITTLSAAVLLAQWASLLALAALQFHLLRRWCETVSVMVYPQQARMHAIAYIFGLRFADVC